MKGMYLVVETNIYYEGKRRAIEQAVLSLAETENEAVEKIKERNSEVEYQYDNDGNFMNASASGKGWSVIYSVVQIQPGDMHRDIINISL